MKTNGFIIILFLLSCSDDVKNVKKEFYSSGRIKSEVPLINGKENGVLTTYYENGDLCSSINKKHDLKDGYSYFFYSNGILKSIGHFTNGEPDGNFTWFNQNGDINYIAKFEKNVSRSFMEFDDNGNIINSSPFISIQANKETIKFGEEYIAKITTNFSLANYDCKVYVKTDSTKENGNIYTKISDNENGVYRVFPKEVGEYILDVSVLYQFELLVSPN